MTKTIFTERLKEARNNKGLTQKELADILGIKRTTYTNYEQSISNPNLETLVRITDILGVSTDYLLGRGKIHGKISKNPITEEEISRIKELLDALKINIEIENRIIKDSFEKVQKESQVELEQMLKHMSIADIMKLLISVKE